LYRTTLTGGDSRGRRRGAVLDVEDAARAGAVSLRPAEGPRASRPTSAAAAAGGRDRRDPSASASGGADPDPDARRPPPPRCEPGAYFAAAFDGGGRRGFVAIDTVGVAPPRVVGGVGPREYSAAQLLRDEDKALVARVADALGCVLYSTNVFHPALGFNI
jgi:hypothetical protein